MKDSIPHDPEKLLEDPYYKQIYSSTQNEKNPSKKADDAETNSEDIYKDITDKISDKTKDVIEKYKATAYGKKLNKEHEISIRVNSIEKEKIEARAKIFGFKNVSDYMRFISLNSYLIAGIDKFNAVVEHTHQTADKEVVEKEFND